MNISKRVTVFAFLAVPLLTIEQGCEKEVGVQHKRTVEASESERPRRVAVHAADVFPHETLTDWISYADQVAVASVVGERELAPSQVLIENGEGYLGRSVTLRVEQTLWTSQRVGPAPEELEIKVVGWIVHDDKRAIADVGNAVRMLVGGRYLVPLVKYSEGWGVLASGAVVPVSGDVEGRRDAEENGLSELGRRLQNESPASVMALLESAPKDPDVEAARLLAPEERVRAVRKVSGPRRVPNLDDPLLKQIMKTRTLQLSAATERQR